MQTTVVRNGQTALDIAIQQAGSVEAVVALAFANGISITDDLVTGSFLVNTDVINKAVVRLYADEKRHPATGETAGDRLEGIDYWYIELDFIVQ